MDSRHTIRQITLQFFNEAPTLLHIITFAYHIHKTVYLSISLFFDESYIYISVNVSIIESIYMYVRL